MTADKIGWIAAFFTVIMSFSFVDQVKLNLSGEKGSAIMFLMMLFNFFFWTTYGIMVKTKQIWITNGLGLFFSVLLIITYFI